MNKKLILIVSVVALNVAFYFIAIPFSVSAFSFTQNLRLGDNNSDVKQLQIFLNRYSDTRIASSGAGSVGYESTYFGSLTLNAVMRFQAKYRADILDPSGLTSPTGFVGPATIKKLNSSAFQPTVAVNPNNQYNQNNQNVPNNIGVSQPMPPTLPISSTSSTPKTPTVSMPVISAISKISANAGDTLIINGSFSGTSVVHFDNNVISNPKIVSSTEIDVIVPNMNDVVMVWISNQYGDSRADFPMFISVGGAASASDLNVIITENNIIHNKAIDPANQ